MGTRVIWFLIGAATATAFWLALTSGAANTFLEQILGSG